jgi:hypothetical protein
VPDSILQKPSAQNGRWHSMMPPPEIAAGAPPVGIASSQSASVQHCAQVPVFRQQSGAVLSQSLFVQQSWQRPVLGQHSCESPQWMSEYSQVPLLQLTAWHAVGAGQSWVSLHSSAKQPRIGSQV